MCAECLQAYFGICPLVHKNEVFEGATASLCELHALRRQRRTYVLDARYEFSSAWCILMFTLCTSWCLPLWTIASCS